MCCNFFVYASRQRAGAGRPIQQSEVSHFFLMRRAERARTYQKNTTKLIFLSHRCTHNRHRAFNIYFHVNESNPKQNVNCLWDNIMRISMNNESINNQSSISFPSLDTILSSSLSNLQTPKRVSESSSASFFFHTSLSAFS